MTTLKVGTRASLLARTQTRLLTEKLLRLVPGLNISEVLIQTEGDISTSPLSQSPTPGIFVSALRESLLRGEVDFIVHSMKDLPAREHPLIALAACPEREIANDVLVSRNNMKLSELPPGSKIGTSSPRRAASIRRVRPDLEVLDIRGNVDSRIHKVRGGQYDATVLAWAGLNRIGRTSEIAEILGTESFLPAPSQGLLAVECLKSRDDLVTLLGVLDNQAARTISTAERSVLVRLNANCATAIGALAEIVDSRLSLSAELSVESTGESVRVSKSLSIGSDDAAAAMSLGFAVAEELLLSSISKKAAL